MSHWTPALKGRFSGIFGVAIIATAFVISMIVAVFHIWYHDAPVVPEILGQGSLLALSVLFGIVGYLALSSVEASDARDTIGVHAGLGYLLAGLTSGGYAVHQHLTPEAVLGLGAILFQAVFVALVGGTAGVLVGLEKARREQVVADLAEKATELEATKADIQTEKQRFESLFQNAPTAIADLRYTAEGPVVARGNTAFEDLLRRTATDVVGKNLFEVVPLQEGKTEQEVAAHVRENEIYVGEVTAQSIGHDHYKLRVIPYEVGEKGERAFALYTDVTELRETQQELTEAVDRLEESNERLEQFAYAISHDLREPLRMVSNYLQLLENRYRDDFDEDAEEFIEFAVDGADRMREMIESLLEYSQVTTRGSPMEPTDADGILDDVLTDLQPRILETDATITADELPTVTVDPDQLAQVFRNLISNALKYHGEEPPRIHVGVEDTGNGWQFSVADQGIGIEPEHRDRLFEVFQTLHTTEEGAGSGIGLALSQRIVERHDGEIWVESEPGEGSTFYFTLPNAE